MYIINKTTVIFNTAIAIDTVLWRQNNCHPQSSFIITNTSSIPIGSARVATSKMFEGDRHKTLVNFISFVDMINSIAIASAAAVPSSSERHCEGKPVRSATRFEIQEALESS